MPEQYTSQDRADLLADVAEMYYLEQKGQAEIARAIGVTRSMVSRMLKETREKGIVEVRVHRALRLDHELEASLAELFGLQAAQVVVVRKASNEQILKYIASAGAKLLNSQLAPGIILGLSWGTSVNAVVNTLETSEPCPVKIVQLVGALGARNDEYDGHALVQRLAEKLGGEGYFLNAPFLCPNAETASTLRETQSVKEALNLGKRAKVALVGVGSASPKYSSYHLAGYADIKELEKLQKAGAVGDVCGIHFDARGRDVCTDFCERSLTIRKEDLLKIPVRIGVAGGVGKVEPMLGALRGGYINMLVTDATAARRVLELSGK